MMRKEETGGLCRCCSSYQESSQNAARKCEIHLEVYAHCFRCLRLVGFFFNCSLSLFALKPLLDRNNLISYFACSLPLTALMISVS